MPEQHVPACDTWRINTKIPLTCRGWGILRRPPAQLVVPASTPNGSLWDSLLGPKRTVNNPVICMMNRPFGNYAWFYGWSISWLISLLLAIGAIPYSCVASDIIVRDYLNMFLMVSIPTTIDDQDAGLACS